MADQDKRLSPRVGVSLPARLTGFTKNQENSFFGLVLDTGPGGLKLRLLGALDLRLNDEVTILVSDSEPNQGLRLSGQVIWLSGQAEPLDSCEVGIRLTETDQGLIDRWWRVASGG